MKGLDLFFDDQVTKLLVSFSYCFKIRLTIFSFELDKAVCIGFYTGNSAYCRLVREQPGYLRHCENQDRTMCTRAEKSPSPLVYQCHAGLGEAVIPIRLNGKVAGYIMAGQFRTRNSVPANIAQDWQNRGFPFGALRAAFLDQPFFEKEALNNMINLFSMLCEFIVSKDHIRLRHLDITRLVILWIEEHIGQPVTLGEAANHFGYSQSSISHVVKNHLGMNFKELCILKKIERFEAIMTSNPSLTIQNAASQVGYDDPLYFSRIYKKVRKKAPSAFVKEVRQAARK
ncbi:MAG: PocR ligand-binding domain-containing protein, partial [Treponema sp.]|nr:PocR ligand-binding domain-containing protein [Treponema sp.]